AGVIGGLRTAQAGNALRCRVAIGARLGHGLEQFVDDVLRGRLVGIAHAEIDDVRPAGARLGLEAIDLGRDIGRQQLDAMEFLKHVGSTVSWPVRSSPNLEAPAKRLRTPRGEPLGSSARAPGTWARHMGPARRLNPGREGSLNLAWAEGGGD